MKAKEAYSSEIELECSCVNISEFKWDYLMEGAKKACGKKIRSMIKKQIPELYDSLCLDLSNPYEANCVRTETHLIYVHSGIEYFFKIKN